ncbi:MAG: hypothetical protein K4304_02805 [Propionicimonas sp.]
MSSDPSKLAMEYQRRLRALQDAQADLAQIQAALRRLRIDRPHLDPVDADRQGRQLEAADRRGEAVVSQRRMEAEEARRDLRRAVEGEYEPQQIIRDEPGEGFQQPPFTAPH